MHLYFTHLLLVHMKKHDSTWNEEKKSMILKNNSYAVEANKDFEGKISDFLLNISSSL